MWVQVQVLLDASSVVDGTACREIFPAERWPPQSHKWNILLQGVKQSNKNKLAMHKGIHKIWSVNKGLSPQLGYERIYRRAGWRWPPLRRRADFLGSSSPHPRWPRSLWTRSSRSWRIRRTLSVKTEGKENQSHSRFHMKTFHWSIAYPLSCIFMSCIHICNIHPPTRLVYCIALR